PPTLRNPTTSGSYRRPASLARGASDRPANAGGFVAPHSAGQSAVQNDFRWRQSPRPAAEHLITGAGWLGFPPQIWYARQWVVHAGRGPAGDGPQSRCTQPTDRPRWQGGAARAADIGTASFAVGGIGLRYGARPLAIVQTPAPCQSTADNRRRFQ